MLTSLLSLLSSFKALLIEYSTLFQWIAYGSASLVILTLILLPWYINRLPEDFFSNERYHTAKSLFHHPIINLFGSIMIIAGMLMLILPGQGLMAIAAGIMIMRFPGKLAMIRKVIHYPHVLDSLNWIRKRGEQKPFTL